MKRLSGVVVLCALALVWECVSRAGMVSTLYFPPVSTIAAVFWELTVSWTLPAQAGETFARAVAGLLAALVLAGPLGLAMGTSRR